MSVLSALSPAFESVPSSVPSSEPGASAPGALVKLTYDESVKKAANYATPPYCLEVGMKDGKDKEKLAVYVDHKLEELQRKHLRESSFCRTCGEERFPFFVSKTGKDGEPLLGGAMNPSLVGFCSHQESSARHKKVLEMAEKVRYQPVVGVSFIKPNQSFVGGHELQKGGFHHLACKMDPKNRTTVSISQLRLIEAAWHRYNPQMHGFLDSLFKGGLVKAKISLQLMAKCLKVVHYGTLFEPTLVWLQHIVSETKKLPTHMTSEERVVFELRILLWAPIIEDNETAVSPFFQTATGNVLDLLNTADGEKQMINMLKNRLGDTYKRRTAVPSVGQVNVAMNALGDFSTGVMTQKWAIENLPQLVSLSSDTLENSNSAFERMKQNAPPTKGKGNPNSSFADRCEATPMSEQIRLIETLRGLVDFCRKNPAVTVEMPASLVATMYVATCTLPPAKLSQPHLWAFTRGYGCGTTEGYVELSMILPMYEYCNGKDGRHALFIPKKVNIEHPFGNCCFPTFLSSRYHMCSVVFEELNKKMKIKIPDGPLMYGVGVSVTDSDGKLSCTLNFRVGGVPLRIDRIGTD